MNLRISRLLAIAAAAVVGLLRQRGQGLYHDLSKRFSFASRQSIAGALWFIMASFAPRATRKIALRDFMLTLAVVALYGWSAAAQTLTTYTYTATRLILQAMSAIFILPIRLMQAARR